MVGKFITYAAVDTAWKLICLFSTLSAIRFFRVRLLSTMALIVPQYPEYTDAFTLVMGRTWAHMFNMFVMRRDLFDAYCEWLFSVLFELEKRLDISSFDSYNIRVFGFVSERLLDVWLEKNHIPYKEQNVSFLEKQNWLKKGGLFLKRKFFGR